MAVRKPGKQVDANAVEKAFSCVTKLWLEHWREGKSTRHVETPERRIALNVLPVLGAKHIDQIQDPEVVAMMRLN